MVTFSDENRLSRKDVLTQRGPAGYQGPIPMPGPGVGPGGPPRPGPRWRRPCRWRAMFDQAMARIAGRFGRVEPPAAARAYLRGLLSSVERKNCWQLAEQAGHTRPGPKQRLLRYARRDADAVRDDPRTCAADRLGAGDAALVVDETGFVKKGRSSAGVQRQYTGTAGPSGTLLVRSIQLTVAEVRRLLAACRPPVPHLHGHRGQHDAVSWSNWRRRRQAVARRRRYLRRCCMIEERSSWDRPGRSVCRYTPAARRNRRSGSEIPR